MVLSPAFADVGLWLIISTLSEEVQLLFRIVHFRVFFPGARPDTWLLMNFPEPLITLHSPLPINAGLGISDVLSSQMV